MADNIKDNSMVSKSLKARSDRGNVVIVLLLLMVAWFIVVNLQSWILDVKEDRMSGSKSKQAQLLMKKRKARYADPAEAVRIYQNPYEKVSR